jgi:formiminotetrahydrofolate cyclodeaminase
MKLVEKRIKSYLYLLKSDAPAPGGGSANALSAAQGVALVLMVCDLTILKEKYAEHKKLCIDAKDKLLDLFNKLLVVIDKDATAFTKVSEAYKLPKGTDEENAMRNNAILEATLMATETPYVAMIICMQALEITQALVGHSNPNVASDLGVAALNFISCIKGSYLNVVVNLPAISDEIEKDRFSNAAYVVEQSDIMAKKIYKDVLASL